MRLNIEKYSLFIVNNYFLFTAINGLLFMVGFAPVAKLELLVLLAGTIISASYLSRRCTFVDFFILLFTTLFAFLSLFQRYSFNLWYEGCRTQLFLIVFFFVGRYFRMANNLIFENAFRPFVLTCIIGLCLYLISPSWYIDYKMQIWDDGYSDSGRLLEMSRLSAFWQYPYWVSYGCAILGLYVLYDLFVNENVFKRNLFLLMFMLFITVLTQQRAPLGVIFVFLTFYIFREFFTKREYLIKRSIIRYICYLLLLIFSLLILIVNILDVEMLLRLIEKIEMVGSTSNFISERAGIFNEFSKIEISIFGDGIGKYSHLAFFEGKKAITDQQYMKILYELGYSGCIFYFVVVVSVILKGARHLKCNLFELSVIFFYLIAMTGANCLAVSEEHTMIFWLCCGRIYNEECLRYKKNLVDIKYGK